MKITAERKVQDLRILRIPKGHNKRFVVIPLGWNVEDCNPEGIDYDWVMVGTAEPFLLDLTEVMS